MARSNRQSFLDYQPIDFSLTDGTNIPPPEATPPATANGSNIGTNGAATETMPHHSHLNVQRDHVQSQSPGPESIMSKSTTPKKRGMRRLFSLGSLRSSFSSSRASLSLPRESIDHDAHGVKRASSPSASFATAATTQHHEQQQRPPSRATIRKSDSWFRRKSGVNFANGGLGTIGEDGRPESKRLREHSPPPLLPEIKSLAGGDLKDGEVDWDEKVFKKPA